MQTIKTFDPHQYAIDHGWDFTCIEATARSGVSEADAEILAPAQQTALLDWCKQQTSGQN